MEETKNCPGHGVLSVEAFAWMNKAKGRRQTYCKDCRKTMQKRIYREDPNGSRAARATPEYQREVSARAARKLRGEILAHYGDRCSCPNCPFNGPDVDPVFLTVDHIEGGGRAHRREVGSSFYRWLRANGFPEGFRALCWSCNAATHIKGVCPHTATP